MSQMLVTSLIQVLDNFTELFYIKLYNTWLHINNDCEKVCEFDGRMQFFIKPG